ncbi:MAG: hypothetical protein JWN47_1362, partial [Frankiales bacterium]|nr:hypothetical protein [Frankiales bacterium]
MITTAQAGVEHVNTTTGTSRNIDC